MAARTFSSLGDVMQLAFVPSDFDAALEYWTGTMGAGPFFLMRDIRLPNAIYRGGLSETVFSIAIGYWGDMQIELIRPENEAPSIYGDEYGVRDRLHHVCILVESFGAARSTCEAIGANILFEARIGADGGVIYADPGAGPGGLVELLVTSPDSATRFATMREAAIGWDGSDPLRTLQRT